MLRASGTWRRANTTTRAGVVGALVLALVGGTVLATNEDAQNAFTEATGLSVTGSSVQIHADSGEPGVGYDPATDGFQWFVRGQDNKLWVRKKSAGQWNWLAVSSPVTAQSAIAVVNDIPPQSSGAPATGVRVFMRGSDNALWTKQITTGFYGTWTSLGGYVTSTPAAIWAGSSDAWYLTVVVKGGDDQYYSKTMSSNGVWGDYHAMGGTFTSAPAIARWQGFYRVFGRGTDNALYTGFLDGGAWSSLGGVLTSGPAVIRVTNPGGFGGDTETLHVYARGTDNTMWHRELHYGASGSYGFHEDFWYSWESKGGAFTSGPSVYGTTAYGRGTDGREYSRSLSASAWTALP